MNQDQFFQIIEALSQAKTNEEWARIVSDNLGILSRAALQWIWELSQLAQLEGDDAGARDWADMTARLADYRAQVLAQHDPSVIPELDSEHLRAPMPPPSARWAQTFRAYLASGEAESGLLSQAIAEARTASSEGVLDILLAYEAKNYSEVISSAPPLFEKLRAQGQIEEAGTVALSYLFLPASQAEQFKNRPLHEQNAVLEAGLQAAQTAMEISQQLYDQPCVAFFAVIRGRGYYEAGRLEEAEAAYWVALGLYEELAKEQPEASNQYVAGTQNNLGNVLSDRRRLEEAEDAFRVALGLYEELATERPEVFNQDVAMTQNNLGNVLRDMGRLEDAEDAYRKALKIRLELATEQPEASNQYVAGTQNNLGNVLSDLRRLEEAEDAYWVALGLYEELAKEQPEASNQYVATTQHNLGAVLRDMGRLEDAEDAYRKALKIRLELATERPEVFNQYVAMTQNNLGNVLSDLRRLEEAEDAFGEALELYRQLKFTHERPRVLNNLAKFFMRQERWGEALGRLDEGVQLIERMRTEALSLERQQQVLASNFGLYENLLLCLLKQPTPDVKRALVVAEQGRSRTLIDLMAAKDVEPPGLSAGECVEYKRVLNHIRGIQVNPEWTLDYAHRRYEQLVQLIKRNAPDFALYAEPLNHAQILQVARDADATLVMFRVTSEGTFVFLVFPDGNTEMVEAPDLTTGVLNDMVAHFEEVAHPEGKRPEPVSGWLVAYQNYVRAPEEPRAEKIRRREEWQETMDSTLQSLQERLMARFQDKLSGSTNLVFVPNRALAILPLHACSFQEGGRETYWGEKFTIRYAPNLFIFKRCLAQENKLNGAGTAPAPDTLLGVIDPHSNLRASVWEGQQIEKLLGASQCHMLWQPNATRENFDRELKGQSFVHFSCHGHCDMRAPLLSALGLANGTKLTLGDIFESLNLPTAWLVVLSACETSLTNGAQATDEQFGLSTGFLYSGAPTVFASLWAVSDASTALLMTHAYELLQTKRDKKAALKDAQKWLRELTVGEILDTAPQSESSYEADMRDWLDSQATYNGRDYRPYAHPIWWAAFQCVGA